nr:calcineurin b-like protein 5 [Quercus suber]
MAQQTLWSRFTPVAITVTGIAVVLGGYYAYTHAPASINQPALRRSNAIHPRRQRPDSNAERPPDPTFLILDADADGPLGYVMILYNLDSEIIPVGIKDLPQIADLEQHLDVPAQTLTPALETVLVMSALAAVFRACDKARLNNHRARIAQVGCESLMEAIEQHGIFGVRDHASQLAGLLNRSVSQEFMDALYNAYDTEIHRDDQLAQDGLTSSVQEVSVPVEVGVEYDQGNQEPSDELKGLLYHIAEDQARRKAYEHRGINCEGCGEMPIRGTRWHCLNCPDFDLCSSCEAQTVHPKTHVFVKIKIPLPVMSQPAKQHPLWYPGDPRKFHSPLHSDLKRTLATEHGFEEPMIDALYDQFTSLANVAYPRDPANVKAAIDRRAFNKALTSERWTSRFTPNALYDRMFAFYDTDNNGLIGFPEFVAGLSYLRGPLRLQSLDRALKGYDLDDDGFVDRRDFLRLFRAKYDIHKLLTSDMIESHEAEQTYAAMDVLRSSQPISSIFSQEEIPPGSDRPRSGKQADMYGDMQPLEGIKTILDDDDDWVPRQVHNTNTEPSPELLRRHLSRFEELLYDNSGPVDGAANEGNFRAEPASTASEGAKRIHLPYEHFSDHDLFDEPSHDDILWQIVENGLNEMLDPIFKRKEEIDLAISQTRAERVKFRKEIKHSLHERHVFEENEERGFVDPSTAEPSNVHEMAAQRNPEPNTAESDTAFEPSFRGEIVPTDSESLAKRERDISEQPLTDLLDATGYSVINQGTESDPTFESLWPRYNSQEANIMLATSGDPIFQPDNEPLTREEVQVEKTLSSPERRELYVAYLTNCQLAEDAIKARGGPGRLSYSELHRMVELDSRKELKGLVMSWLEWASF